MAVTHPDAVKPRWPDVIDPGAVDLDYEPFVDELTLFFGGPPVPSYSDLIQAPEGDDVMVMVGIDEADESTGEVVGIHVYPLAAGALVDHPEWRALAAPSPSTEAVAAFIADVADLFERYWRPAPPIEEQLARLARASGRGDGVDGV